METLFSSFDVPIPTKQSTFIGQPKCASCNLYKRCKSPKMKPTGKGKKRILIVGEAPGSTEDEKGKQLIGRTGSRLNDWLSEVGIDMRRDCILDNAIRCWPHNGYKNRKPTDREVEYCHPNVLATIQKHDPEIILVLGKVPLQSIMDGIWREKLGPVTRWVGWHIPSQIHNAWICPVYHPSYICRAEDKTDFRVLEKLYVDSLRAAVGFDRRPWKTVPNYRDKIQVIHDTHEAAEILNRLFHDEPETIAFDYETDRIKPDSPHSQIVCCSISDGTTTIAFPIDYYVTGPLLALLRHPKIGKIASNMKFEQRWTLRHFGCYVKNWDWDTMLAAHWLDNRSGVTSIKFQALTRLGFPIYDENVRQYLKASGKGGNAPNRIRECPVNELLLYNGLDSLLEWKIAKLQKKEGKYA